LGIFAVADLFHGTKRQVYSTLAREICATTPMDLQRSYMRCGRGAA